MRWLALPALALGLALHGDTDPSAPTLVQLDVSVRDARGRPVPGVDAQEFRVTEGGAPVTVVSAQFIPPFAADPAPAVSPIESSDDERAAVQRPGIRVFTFFLDEYHVSATAAPRVREVVSAFIRDETAAGDLLLVLKPLDSLLSLRLTRDRTAALASVASFEGRLGDYVPRNAFERELVAGDPARIDLVRAQIGVSAIHALTAHLARLRGPRKAVIVVSEGFPTRPARRGGEVLPNADAVIRAANGGTAAIYHIDARALGAGNRTGPENDAPSSGSGREVMLRFANETDGRALGAPATDSLRGVAADLSGYYLLTLQGAADGQYHPLDVQVSRPGAHVRVRRGYWAVSLEELQRAKRAAAPPPPRPPALPPVRTSRLIRPWFGQARGADGRTRLTVVWEPAPGAAVARGPILPPSRLVVKAATLDGLPVYEGVIGPAYGGMGAIAARAVFDAPAGRLRLQMSIEDAAARVLDTDVRDLIVTALPGPLAFGTPAVFRARTAREFNALVEDVNATPAAAREFSRVERLLIRLPLYAPAASVSATAALANRAGQTMRELTVIPPRAATDLYAVDVPLAGLAAGEYAVLLRARDGTDEVRETVGFRVTP